MTTMTHPYEAIQARRGACVTLSGYNRNYNEVEMTFEVTESGNLKRNGVYWNFSGIGNKVWRVTSSSFRGRAKQLTVVLLHTAHVVR